MSTTTAQPSAPAIRAIAAEPGHVSPPFNPRFNSYTLFLPHDVETFAATVDAGDGQLTINGAATASGERSAAIRVPVGRNVVPIVVTSPDGQTSRAYSLIVQRPQPTPNWRSVTTTNPWPGRDSAGELVFNDHMWLFGGYTPKVIDDVWRSTDGINWEPMPALEGSGGVNIPIRFVLHDQMWITGGNGSYFRSKDGKSWTRITETMPWAGRITAGSVVFGGRVWIMGGLQAGKRLNDVWSSADGLNWRQETAAAPWSPRQLHDNVLAFDGHLWVIGGSVQSYHPLKTYRDVWRSPDGIHWEQVTDEAPWLGRNWGSTAVYRDRMWLFGGFRSEPKWHNLNDVWYSADGATWHQLTTPDVWSARHELSPYVYRDKLWVVGGNAWPLLNDVWQLDIKGLTFLTQPVIEDFVDAEYHYRPRADFNRSRQPVRYRLTEHPDWLSINPDTGVIRGRLKAAGSAAVTVEAFDAAGETARQCYTLLVHG